LKPCSKPEKPECRHDDFQSLAERQRRDIFVVYLNRFKLRQERHILAYFLMMPLLTELRFIWKLSSYKNVSPDGLLISERGQPARVFMEAKNSTRGQAARAPAQTAIRQFRLDRHCPRP
jgi:hypothetical protein